jgi:hypothetical protein
MGRWTEKTYSCGHSDADGWGEKDSKIPWPCWPCRKARIGQEIKFARFGAPPRSGKSFNHMDGCEEKGVSVYEIVDGKINFVGISGLVEDRPEYRGVGKITGWGADGEPVVEILKIRKVRKARK